MRIEDAVRQALLRQVDNQPPMADPAGRAIAGAGAVRTRRAIIGAVAGTAVLVVAVGGLSVLRDHRGGPLPPAGRTPTPPTGTAGPTPTRSAPAATGTPVNVSVIVGRKTLVTGDGGRIDLGGVPGGVTGAYRTKDGWLVQGYGTGDSAMSLWLVRRDGSLHPIVTGATSRVVVAPDGRGIAWRTADRMYTGHITDGFTLVVDASTPVPERGSPIVYTGTAVYVGAAQSGGGIDMHDVWLPDKGDYVPTWDTPDHNRIFMVYGVAPDGHSLVGMVRAAAGSKQGCLALLDPVNGLRVTGRTACGAVGIVNPPVAMSPDGHWLAVLNAHSDAPPMVSLIDLNTVFDSDAVTTSLEYGTAPGVWLDDNTLIVLDDPLGPTPLLRFRVGTGGGTAGEPVTVPGLPAGTKVDGIDAFLVTPLR